MGAVASLICSATFCLERVLTWACCAFLLILLMFIIMLLIIYGISVGYHYAQKELASFALWSRVSTTPRYVTRGGEDNPALRLLALNNSEPDFIQVVNDENSKPDARIDEAPTEEEDAVAETVPYTSEPTRTSFQVLSQREKELARILLGRYRRSRTHPSSASTKTQPFLRPLRATSSVLIST